MRNLDTAGEILYVVGAKTKYLAWIWSSPALSSKITWCLINQRKLLSSFCRQDNLEAVLIELPMRVMQIYSHRRHLKNLIRSYIALTLCPSFSPAIAGFAVFYFMILQLLTVNITELEYKEFFNNHWAHRMRSSACTRHQRSFLHVSAAKAMTAFSSSLWNCPALAKFTH